MLFPCTSLGFSLLCDHGATTVRPQNGSEPYGKMRKKTLNLVMRATNIR